MDTQRFSLKKVAAGFAILLLLVFCYFLIQPLPAATNSNCRTHVGLVDQVEHGPSGDIIIRLRDDKNIYYINRGTQSGISTKDMQTKLQNKQVQLLTIIPRYPFINESSTKHIAQVKVEDVIMYSEL